MSTHHIKKQLRGLRVVAPSVSWREAHRDLLMRQIRSQVTDRPAVVTTGQRIRIWLSEFEAALQGNASALAARSVTVVALVVVLLFGTGGYVVAAADQSVPGQALYPLKIAIEDTRLSLASDQKERVKLRVEFAARRLDELSKLAKLGNTEPKLATLVNEFESNVTNASAAVSELSDKNSTDSLDAARLVDDKIAAYQHSLRETSAQLKDRDVSDRVGKAIAAVNKAGTQALKVIADSDGVSKDDLAQKIDDKIKVAEDALKEADGKLSGGAKDPSTTKAMGQSSAAKENLAEAKQKVIEGDYKAALSILENVEDIVTQVANSANTVSADGEVKGAATTNGEVTPESAGKSESSQSSTTGGGSSGQTSK